MTDTCRGREAMHESGPLPSAMTEAAIEPSRFFPAPAAAPNRRDPPCVPIFPPAYVRLFPVENLQSRVARRAPLWRLDMRWSPAYGEETRAWDLSMPIRLVAQSIDVNACD